MDPITQALETLIAAIAQRERGRLLALFTDGMPGPVKTKATNGSRVVTRKRGRASYGSRAHHVQLALQYIQANPGCKSGDFYRAAKYPGNKQGFALAVRSTGRVVVKGSRAAARYYPKG